MRRGAALVLLALLAPATSVGADEARDAAERGLEFLALSQRDDGAFAAFPTNVVEAASAAGRDAWTWPSPERPAFASLKPYGNDEPSVYYSHLRLAYAAAAAGYDPRDVNGEDHVAATRAGFHGTQFGSAAFLNDDAWAILALRAAGVPADDPQVQAALGVLASAQRIDGGWSYQVADVAGWTDVTGMVIAALHAADALPEDRARIVGFLDSTRVAGGGHADKPGGAVANCQSTVWALHAYHLLGAAASEGSVGFLLGLQRDDGGFAVSAAARNSNGFCTSEAVLYLAGGRHPLPGHAAARVEAPAVHARETATVRVGAPFTRLDVAWEDGATGASRVFDEKGSRAFRYHAQGAGVHARGAGTLDVLTARPVVGALPPLVELARHADLALDLASATDPDGEVVAFEVDWGDGNVTDRTTHAYTLPGEHVVRVRARDDEGAWSLPATTRVVVANRPPALAPLPERLVADRAHPLALPVSASDADGDALAITWSFGARTGAGPPSFTPDALGTRTLEVRAGDGFGGVATARVEVEVVNLPPTLSLDLPATWRAGEPLELRALVADPDGAAPTVAWSVDGRLVDRPRVLLAAGTREVRALVTDADGANASATASIVVHEAPADAPPAPEPAPRVPPTLEGVRAEWAGDALRVTYDVAPADARVRVSWRSDAGDGEAQAAGSPHEVALPNATWASALVLVEHDGLTASRSTGVVVRPAEAPAPRATQAATTVTAAAPEAWEAPDAEAARLESAALTPGEERATPMPAPWLLATLAMLAASGARPPRTRRR